MRVLSEAVERLTDIPYLRAGASGPETAMLPVEIVAVDAVPDGCDAVLVTSDLQGVATSPWGGEPQLLGVVLADYLAVWADSGLIPRAEGLGVLLAGDFFSAPTADQRGMSGDVTDVWLAFALAGCRWLTGIAGNHDQISPRLVAEMMPSATLLDGSVIEEGHLRIAGVGGIIGDPRQPQRRSTSDFLRLVETLTATAPTTLLLHEGPSGVSPGQPGNTQIRALLERRSVPLVVCGHVGWDRPVSPLSDGHVVNVDGRAVILMPADQVSRRRPV